MKQISFTCVIAVATLAMAGAAQAGTCRDPWVTQAVQQVTGHAPNGSYESGDCNIHNYGGGSWSSYPDLITKVRAHFGMQASAAGVCRDPWVTRAVTQVMGRAPQGSGESGECNIHRYGGGSWSSYDDLVHKVQVAFGMVVQPNGANGRYGSNNPIPASPIAGGAGVITAGGGNVITAGGGNVITAGSGN